MAIEIPGHCIDTQFFSSYIVDLYNFRYCANGTATHWRGRDHLRRFYGNHQTKRIGAKGSYILVACPLPAGINPAPTPVQPGSYLNRGLQGLTRFIPDREVKGVRQDIVLGNRPVRGGFSFDSPF